jgi:hypothetical protein
VSTGPSSSGPRLKKKSVRGFTEAASSNPSRQRCPINAEEIVPSKAEEC